MIFGFLSKQGMSERNGVYKPILNDLNMIEVVLNVWSGSNIAIRATSPAILSDEDGYLIGDLKRRGFAALFSPPRPLNHLHEEALCLSNSVIC